VLAKPVGSALMSSPVSQAKPRMVVSSEEDAITGAGLESFSLLHELSNKSVDIIDRKLAALLLGIGMPLSKVTFSSELHMGVRGLGVLQTCSYSVFRYGSPANKFSKPIIVLDRR
jgi:hypothetical protein